MVTSHKAVTFRNTMSNVPLAYWALVAQRESLSNTAFASVLLLLCLCALKLTTPDLKGNVMCLT